MFLLVLADLLFAPNQPQPFFPSPKRRSCHAVIGSLCNIVRRGLNAHVIVSSWELPFSCFARIPQKKTTTESEAPGHVPIIQTHQHHHHLGFKYLPPAVKNKLLRAEAGHISADVRSCKPGTNWREAFPQRLWWQGTLFAVPKILWLALF